MKKLTTHCYDSTGEAYNACQTDENIKDGDILVIASEQVVGIAWTWPIAVTKDPGNLHQIEPGTSFAEFEDGKFVDRLEQATMIASLYGYETQR